MEFLGSAVVGLSVGLGISSAVPAALSAVGFTKGGIAAGSLAAKMMSCSAIANGGRVAAGSLVAIAQSLGAAGLPAAVKAVLATIAAALATVFTPVLV